EAAAQGFPEVARAVRLERWQELGEQLLAESLTPASDERKARVRDEAPEPLGRAPLRGRDHQPAELCRALVREAQAQQRVMEMLVERPRVALFIDHVEV